MRRDGVPNYFDDQRFGSVGDEPDFIARRMIRGEFEDALRLALAEPYPYDRAAIKREKSILREYWGRWAECKPLLPRGHARSLVDYLVHHPTDYRGAVARLRPDLQGLFLAAYQSYLWNAILGAWIGDSFSSEELLPLELRLGNTPAPRSLNDEQRAKWQAVKLPLPAARWRLDPSAEYAAPPSASWPPKDSPGRISKSRDCASRFSRRASARRGACPPILPPKEAMTNATPGDCGSR